MPAFRRAGEIADPARVARRSGCRLVVLCSGNADVERVAHVATRFLPPEQVIVADLPLTWELPEDLRFEADLTHHSRARAADTSIKRNIGLLLAWRLGWERVLFLDDDVFGLRPAHLELASRSLGRAEDDPEVVAWAFDDFPDNSVVCHAYRETNGRQCTFAGGGALAVRLLRSPPFFPRMYNEDWFFMLPYLRRHPSKLLLAGGLRQRPFDPFAEAADAVRQEFGDVAAEGLFRLHRTTRSLARASDPDWWLSELDRRRAFVGAVLERLTEPRQESMRRAVRRAQDTLAGADGWEHDLVEWVQLWRDDLKRRPDTLGRRGSARSAVQIFSELGLQVRPGPERHPLRARASRWRAFADTHRPRARQPEPAIS